MSGRRYTNQEIGDALVDGYKLNMFVKAPDGDASRPFVLVWHAPRSRKILASQIVKAENTAGYSLSVADLLEKCGIPGVATLNNARFEEGVE